MLKTYDEAGVYEVDGIIVETRYRIDVAVEFMSLEGRGYFTNVFKDGSMKNVQEFVSFMTWKV